MTKRLRLELEPEVEQWLASLDGDDVHQATQALDRLEQLGSRLRMPFSRPLGDGLFELRLHCAGAPRRVTYWYASNGRVIALTTFRKQRSNEQREIKRARNALRRCRAEHEVGGHDD